MYYSSLTMVHIAGVIIPFVQMRKEDREAEIHFLSLPKFPLTLISNKLTHILKPLLLSSLRRIQNEEAVLFHHIIGN